MPNFTQFPEEGTVADGNLLIGIATRLGLTNPRLTITPGGSGGAPTGIVNETPISEVSGSLPGLAIYQLKVDEAVDSVNVNITLSEIRQNVFDGLNRFLGNLGQAGTAQGKISDLVMALPGVESQVKTELGL